MPHDTGPVLFLSSPTSTALAVELARERPLPFFLKSCLWLQAHPATSQRTYTVSLEPDQSEQPLLILVMAVCPISAHSERNNRQSLR